MSALISAQSPYLHQNGPIYPVVITPSFPIIEALKLEKKDVPHIKVQALFDTGAQTTAISDKISSFLKLIPKGTVISGPGLTEASIYQRLAEKCVRVRNTLTII